MEPSSAIRNDIGVEIEKNFIQLRDSKKPLTELKRINELIGSLREHHFDRLADHNEKRLTRALQERGLSLNPPSSAKIILGTKNQFSFGENESCSGMALAFLNASMTGMKSSVDEVLEMGAKAYTTVLGEKESQEKVLGVSDVDTFSKQLHPANLIEVFEGIRPTKSPNSVAVSSSDELAGAIGNVGKQLVTQSLREGKAGSTIAFNGKTYALFVEMDNDKPVFSFFDSHGPSRDMPAFVLKSTKMADIINHIKGSFEIIGRTFNPTVVKDYSAEEMKLLSVPHDGDNELGLYFVGALTKPAAKASSSGCSLM